MNIYCVELECMRVWCRIGIVMLRYWNVECVALTCVNMNEMRELLNGMCVDCFHVGVNEARMDEMYACV